MPGARQSIGFTARQRRPQSCRYCALPPPPYTDPLEHYSEQMLTLSREIMLPYSNLVYLSNTIRFGYVILIYHVFNLSLIEIGFYFTKIIYLPFLVF